MASPRWRRCAAAALCLALCDVRPDRGRLDLHGRVRGRGLADSLAPILAALVRPSLGLPPASKYTGRSPVNMRKEVIAGLRRGAFQMRAFLSLILLSAAIFAPAEFS